MLTDVLADRQLELNAKIGAILEKAKIHSVDVPLTEKYYAAIIENS